MSGSYTYCAYQVNKFNHEKPLYIHSSSTTVTIKTLCMSLSSHKRRSSLAIAYHDHMIVDFVNLCLYALQEFLNLCKSLQ